ncbi:MAG TPA: MFS transporter [Prolixibacteraceae bacterium]|nr:MFS transporter [Prolixibacteraceae bacterium]
MDSKNNQKQWAVLLTTMFASFMNPFMLSGVNISLPNIQHDFECSATLLSWTINSFLLANAIVLLPLSKISDVRGRAKFFKIGLYLFTLFSIGTALSPTITMFIIMRIFQGAGAAMMQVTAMAIVTSAYPPEKRGVALGLNIGAVYTGLSLGPFIGGLLTQYGGWQWVFLASVPLAIIAILLAHLNLSDKKEELIDSSFDWKGSIIYAVAILCLVYGGGKILTLHGTSLFIAGSILFYLFFRFEKKNASPIFNVKLFISNKLFSFSNLAALIHYMATSGTGFLLSLYLQFSKGLSPRDAGLILVAQPIIMAISTPLTGRLSDKTRPGILASIGMFITLAGLFSFTLLTKETPVEMIIGILVMLGLGFGFFSSPNTNAIMGSVEKKDYGIASGTSATMRVFGQTLSMMIATIFISLMLGKQQVSADTIDFYMKSMKICFTLFALLCIPGIWFSLQRNK